MKNNTILIAIVVLVVGLGAGFFGGMKYQQSQTSIDNFRNGPRGQFGGRTGTPGADRRMTGGMRNTAGEIISVDSNSITVKLQDGSSKIVLLNEKTSINKASIAQIGDLKTGEIVAVFGTTNTDGSVTAQNIQLNPLFRGGGVGKPSGATIEKP